MHFKLLPVKEDKYTSMGMINVYAQLFLDPGDEGYDKYIAEHLVTVDGVEQFNPFCTHSIQFEHDATEEEILWCFEWALGITHQNYLKDDLHCKKDGQVVNQPFHYIARKAFYEGVSMIPEDDRSDYMKTEMAKTDKAKGRVSKIKNVDFGNVKTIGKYRVRK